MKAQDLVNRVRDVAINYKTLYVYACFGAPLNNANKQRYTNNCDYNRQASRRNKINAASSDTFGFDCVNLIKGILWGWRGDLNHTYGGAVYASNGCPDTNANGMFWDYCHDQSNDFSNIIPGEFVWMEGHIGVYIGDGYVVECTPIWNDGVQITYLGNWGGSRPGYSTRTWTSHGKSNLIDYSEQPAPTPTPTYKYKIGDKVVVNGELFYTSMSGQGAGAADHVYTQVTRIAEGARHPYNFVGDLGWADESSISYQVEPKPEPTPTKIVAGDIVKVTGSGNASSDGLGSSWTKKFENQTMKVILINEGAAFPYACNQYGSGTVGNPDDVTGWFAANDVKK